MGWNNPYWVSTTLGAAPSLSGKSSFECRQQCHWWPWSPTKPKPSFSCVQASHAPECGVWNAGQPNLGAYGRGCWFEDQDWWHLCLGRLQSVTRSAWSPALPVLGSKAQQPTACCQLSASLGSELVHRAELARLLASRPPGRVLSFLPRRQVHGYAFWCTGHLFTRVCLWAGRSFVFDRICFRQLPLLRVCPRGWGNWGTLGTLGKIREPSGRLGNLRED